MVDHRDYSILPEFKDVFILGAGSSKDYGFPLGSELLTQINSLVTSDDSFRNICLTRFKYSQEAIQALTAISSTINMRVNDSIDEILSSPKLRKEFVESAKLAIIKIIAENEINSKNYFDENHNWDQGENKDWMHYFWTHYIKQRIIDRDLQQTLFINFNYDRSFVYNILKKAKNYCEHHGISDYKIDEHFHIYHPYGSLGGLSSVPFGDTNVLHLNNLPNLIDNIRVINEGERDQDSGLVKYHSSIKKAKRIVFLGFHFDRQNMQRLGFPLPSPLSSTGVLTHDIQLALTNHKMDSTYLRNSIKRHFVGFEIHDNLTGQGENIKNFFKNRFQL